MSKTTFINQKAIVTIEVFHSFDKELERFDLKYYYGELIEKEIKILGFTVRKEKRARDYIYLDMVTGDLITQDEILTEYKGKVELAPIGLGNICYKPHIKFNFIDGTEKIKFFDKDGEILDYLIRNKDLFCDLLEI